MRKLQGEISKKKILLVGCGNMGQALLNGWLKSGISTQNIKVISPSPKKIPCENFSDLSKIKNFVPDVILLAVKPQILEKTLPNYKNITKGKLVISVAAGKTMAFYEKHLGKDAAVVRAMPNLPAVISAGITGIMKNKNVSAKNWGVAKNLFATVGDICELTAEKQFAALTAISGSGPAYVFFFIEALTKAAVKLGLSPADAQLLVLKTVKGAALMAGEEPSLQRTQVTSKGGTTEAALKILMNKSNGLEPLLLAATKAAKIRAQEI